MRFTSEDQRRAAFANMRGQRTMPAPMYAKAKRYRQQKIVGAVVSGGLAAVPLYLNRLLEPTHRQLLQQIKSLNTVQRMTKGGNRAFLANLRKTRYLAKVSQGLKYFNYGVAGLAALDAYRQFSDRNRLFHQARRQGYTE